MNKSKGHHPMAVVTRKTGLTADVIRAWERRHGAVEPLRTPGNHRLYSDSDIDRLRLIRRALECGWQISQVARLTNAEIRALFDDARPAIAVRPTHRDRDVAVERRIERCIDLVAALDSEGLKRQLEEASVELARFDLMDRLLVPLIRRIGDACSEGWLRTAHEHVATAVLRGFLETLRPAYPPSAHAPCLLVTTPAAQHHELGALLVAATGRIEGWHTVYAGPNLPAEEIAAAAQQRGARAVALSIGIDDNDAGLDEELEKLGRLLDPSMTLIAGGRGADTCASTLDAAGAERPRDLVGLRILLSRLRGPGGFDA
jgi:DNA-binding transcriptional MerR regulator/methylmalonyl-CoA mutase cobalamin-binding subunit